MDPCDERLVVRQVGFTNGREVRERIQLPLEGKKPLWLTGRLYWLAPGIIDLHYETVEGDGWWGGAMRLHRRTRHFGHWWDTIPHLWIFDLPSDAQQAWAVGRLMAERAAEAWQHTPDGIPNDAATPIAHTLWMAPSRSLGTRINEGMSRLADAMRRSVGSAKKPIMAPQVVAGDSVVLVEGVGEAGRIWLQGVAQPLGQQIDASDLRPHRVLDWHPKGVGGSRPIRCPQTGQLFNVLCDQHLPMSLYRVVALAADREGSEIARFTAPASLLLSLAITQQHVIVPLQPHRLKQAGEHHFGGHLRVGVLADWQWRPEEELLFYVIHRGTGRLEAIWRAEAALMPYGPINAFEAEDSIYLDAITYDDDRLLHSLAIENLRMPNAMPTGQLRRYCLTNVGCEAARFDGAAGQMERYPEAHSYPLAEHLLGGLAGSGMINGQMMSRPHRYIWALGMRAADRGREVGWPNAIIRIDSLKPTKPLEWGCDHCYPSQPVFVSCRSGKRQEATTEHLVSLLQTPPRSLESLQATPTTPTQRARLRAESLVIEKGAENDVETDGVLLSVVLDVRQQRSFLVIVDAQRMEEMGRYWLPQAIPISWSQGAWSTGMSVVEREKQAEKSPV